MADRTHLTGREPLVAELMGIGGYTGKRVWLEVEDTVDLRSATRWEGGARDYFEFVKLGQPLEVCTHQYLASLPAGSLEAVPVPDGMVCVLRRVGGYEHCTLIVNSRSLNPLMLPAGPAELTGDEQRVLYYTRTLKPGYGGVSNNRQVASRLPDDRWSSAKASLTARKLLTAAGALNTAGKNAAEGLREPPCPLCDNPRYHMACRPNGVTS